MTDDILAVISLGIALASPVIVWSGTRARPASWWGNAALFWEVFAVVIVAAIFARFAAIPALHWLAVRLL